MAEDSGISGQASLGADINKLKTDITQETKQGVVSQKLPELTLEMSDEDIVKLTDKWEGDWNQSNTKQEWEKNCDKNEKYWLGIHDNLPKQLESQPGVDNLIFEALETYLPQATRRNPEPLVTLDASVETNPEAEAYVQKMKLRLADLADKNKIRLKLKKGARHWSIFLIGCAKFGWDLDKDIPIVRIVRPKKIILDPDSTIDEDGYTGDRVGEHRKMLASKMLAIIGEGEESGEAIKAIKEKVGDKVGTELGFIEWWTPTYMCWKMDKVILIKKKNPHWNYDQVLPDTQVDDMGVETPTEQQVMGVNHLASPEMPYKFLSVFNLGDQPMDKTSLIGQNISNQDIITKRNRQIDKNADDMNGGIVVSLARSGLTQAQAKGVTEALRKGGTVVIPDGAPREAIDRYPASGLPPDVYNQLADMRSRLRGIFGVEGSSQAGLSSEDTVRGKIMSRGLDTDRIGGGVTEYLEQWADDWYNWFVQLLYVYDPTFQFQPGQEPPKIVVSVKEGSLLPKDSMSIANQAIELATANKMSLIDLYKRLEYPNPEELAANVWLEVNAPQLLYKTNPLVQEALALQQQAAMAAASMETENKDKEHLQNLEQSEVSHSQNLEKEAMKGDMKLADTKQRSMLSQVKTKG